MERIQVVMGVSLIILHMVVVVAGIVRTSTNSRATTDHVRYILSGCVRILTPAAK
jgi:hypothetical protein